MPIEYYAERPRRLRADGQHTIKIRTTATRIGVSCKCGWFVLDVIQNRDSAEHRGWMHISKPNLLITGSSDIFTANRIAVAKQEYPSLFEANDRD